MKIAIIFGGTGYIGMHTWKRLRERFERVVLADMRAPAEALPEGVEFVKCDVREPVEQQLQDFVSDGQKVDWIFHFSAVHREPGHDFEEYFDTNIVGAENVTAYADVLSVPNMLFTSSIAVYGPTRKATMETTPKYPSTGYGISKLCAELIHERWAAANPKRRLVVCRPGVVYGPGDPGNILRMIQAVKKGIFFFPGSPNIYKSYAYIEGLLDSFEFTMGRGEKVIHYNYVENPTEPLNKLVQHIEQFLGKKTKTIPLPLWALLPAAHMAQWLTNGKSGIHPKRVKKAATPTHIIPQTLIDMGFEFKYDFPSSLNDWKTKSADDF